MKLFVEVHYQVKPGKREEFYRKIQEQGIDTDSRQKPAISNMTITMPLMIRTASA